jgi:aryl-phospho-beta-D-glucosidase BglC (GH1 family)
MKTIVRFTFIATILFSMGQSAPAQQGNKEAGLFDWRPTRDVSRPLNSPHAKKLPLVKVKGNRFINEHGDTVLFRGLAIADPDKISQEGRWNKELFESARQMGAMVVRIPVHPVPWRMRTPAKYLPLLDQAVEWCTDLGMYVMIDWHSIGNLGMELDPLQRSAWKHVVERMERDQ